MKKNIEFIGIYGPTASGKTQLAIELAQKYPIEIISVDSALVYQDMDIGTAKPTPEQMAAIPHHLIDIITPCEKFTVGAFHQRCCEVIDQVRKKNKIPLLVGGTGLYFESITRGYHNLPLIDETVTNKVDAFIQDHGLAHAYQYLLKLDVRHQVLKAGDTQRIHRALCVYEQTGKMIFEFWKTQQPKHQGHIIAIKPDDRDILRTKIKQRMREMFNAGFIDETENIVRKYQLTETHNSMRCVGYRQVFQYLQGTISKEEMKDRVFFATCQYAKRQITWLNRLRDSNVTEVTPEKINKINQIITNCFNNN